MLPKLCEQTSSSATSENAISPCTDYISRTRTAPPIYLLCPRTPCSICGTSFLLTSSMTSLLANTFIVSAHAAITNMHQTVPYLSLVTFFYQRNVHSICDYLSHLLAIAHSSACLRLPIFLCWLFSGWECPIMPPLLRCSRPACA